MAVEQSHTRKSIQEEGAGRSKEQTSFGVIGYVTHYHPNITTDCNCGAEWHEDKGTKILEDHERHTIDVRVLNGSKYDDMYSVPCMMYSQGVIDKGFKKNDRVWIEFIQGDRKQPVATAYYRDPSQMELFFNNLKYSVASVFDEMIGF